LEQNESFSTLKTRVCRKYSSQKLKQFSQGTNVLDAPDSNIHGFLWRDTGVSSTQLSLPISKTESLSTFKNLSFRKHSFQTLIQFCLEYNLLDALASNIDDFLSSDSCGSSTQLNRPIWNKESLCPP
jgi:hypothetical protein